MNNIQLVNARKTIEVPPFQKYETENLIPAVLPKVLLTVLPPPICTAKIPPIGQRVEGPKSLSGTSKR